MRADGARAGGDEGERVDGWAERASLRLLFAMARWWPGFARWSAPFWTRTAWELNPALQRSILANAKRLLPHGTEAQRRQLARAVVRSFYDFVMEMGVAVNADRSAILEKLAGTDGHEHYEEARRLGRGVIVATAHLGSFEVGIAALREHEARIHVVFKRDVEPTFDRLRGDLHRMLGVLDAPIDEGLGLWVRLRDALARDEAVLMQADRAMPMQKGVVVPFGNGHLMLPTGVVRLARASNAPIVPVFAVRQPDGRIRLQVEKAIDVHACGNGDDATSKFDAATQTLARVIEAKVFAHPEQWLMLQPAWLEDQPVHVTAATEQAKDVRCE
ncbi:MAG: hypothetical protein WD294_05190 [Phycisphaeraceae bacterium]